MALNNPYGLDFDGSGDYVSVAHHSSLDFTAMTIEFRVKKADLSPQRYFIQKRSGVGSTPAPWLIYWNSSIQRISYNDTVVGLLTPDSALITADEWAHIAIVRTATKLIFYFNGENITEHSFSSSPISNASVPIYIGIDKQSSSSSFNGIMDEIRLWNIERTPQQIRMFRDCKLNRFTSDWDNLAAYWRCDTGSGSVLYDNSKNSNDGSIIGATWTTDVLGLKYGEGFKLWWF